MICGGSRDDAGMLEMVLDHEAETFSSFKNGNLRMNLRMTRENALGDKIGEVKK